MDSYACQCVYGEPNCHLWAVGRGLRGRHGGWNHVFAFYLTYSYAIDCFTHALLGKLREKKGGKKDGKTNNIQWPVGLCGKEQATLWVPLCIPSPSNQRCSRSGGSLAFSLYITVASEKCPDTLPHCQCLTCFVSTSADVALLDNWASSSSALSLFQDILWSAIIRQYIEYNTTPYPGTQTQGPEGSGLTKYSCF